MAFLLQTLFTASILLLKAESDTRLASQTGCVRKGGGSEGLPCSEPVPDEIVAAAGRGDEAAVLAWLDVAFGGWVDATFTVHRVTMLTVAATEGHERLVHALLQRGADVNHQTSSGSTALMVAARNGRSRVVDALLQHGADINLQTSDGFTALMHAAATGHEHVVDSLLRQGAEVDLQSSKGVTALMFAVSTNRLAAVLRLLRAGADTTPRGEGGEDALTIAKVEEHLECVRAIEEHAGKKKSGQDGGAELAREAHEGFASSMIWGLLIVLCTPGLVSSALLLLPSSQQRPYARRRGRRLTAPEGTQWQLVRPYRLMLEAVARWLRSVRARATARRGGERVPERSQRKRQGRQGRPERPAEAEARERGRRAAQAEAAAAAKAAAEVEAAAEAEAEVAAAAGRAREEAEAIERERVGIEGKGEDSVAPLAAVPLSEANFDTGRPESTLGGESTCIICFAQPKSHAAVPCGHWSACGDCAARIMERDRRCPYCREAVIMWMIYHEMSDLTVDISHAHRPGVVGGVMGSVRREHGS